MPRRPRVHVPGGFYHVTLRGNHQRDLFRADADRELLNFIVARAISTFDARLHAYCWMTNHLHLVLQAGMTAIGDPMRNIAAEFARAMQLKLATTGHYFERRYHATLVDADTYLLELIRYVHRNPVAAGIAADASEYPWSSHHAYVGARCEPWVNVDFVLRMFSEDRPRAVEAYRQFVGSCAEEPWFSTLASNGGEIQVLGGDDFTQRVMAAPMLAKSRQSLPQLIAEGCRRFGIAPEHLNSAVHDLLAVRVRAWIAFQARSRGIATLASVARALGRNEATLRYAMRRYCREEE